VKAAAVVVVVVVVRARVREQRAPSLLDATCSVEAAMGHKGKRGPPLTDATG
jgi:hypothetical protein